MNMKLNQLITLFNSNANLVRAQEMSAYMQNKALFLGINKPVRTKLERDFIKIWAQLPIKEVMHLADELVKLNYREYLYCAQQLLLKLYAKLSLKEIEQLLVFAQINPWWDNIDGWVMVIRRWSALDMMRAAVLVDKYAKDENLWLRRMSIICQLNHQAHQYDERALFKAIELNWWDKEFFIQKAIGWALRDYGKSHPKAVMDFVTKNELKLSKLAIKEATRRIVRGLDE